MALRFFIEIDWLKNCVSAFFMRRYIIVLYNIFDIEISLVRSNKVTSLPQVILLGNIQKWCLYFEIARWCFSINKWTIPMPTSIGLWFRCWFRLLCCWVGTHCWNCLPFACSQIVCLLLKAWSWVYFQSWCWDLWRQAMRRNASSLCERNDMRWTLWWRKGCLPRWLRKEFIYRR